LFTEIAGKTPSKYLRQGVPEVVGINRPKASEFVRALFIDHCWGLSERGVTGERGRVQEPVAPSRLVRRGTDHTRSPHTSAAKVAESPGRMTGKLFGTVRSCPIMFYLCSRDKWYGRRGIGC
jgi:hypothetical protein